MNLKQFRYVLMLADQGSFSKAAEELNISQPSLSQYVRKIENDLGVSLFDRSGSTLRLTDAGKAYLEAGRGILEIERRMKNEFADLNDCRTGTIVIGVSPHRSICILPPAVAGFKRLYPGVKLVIDERVGQELLEKAEKGEYDLCITTLPVDEQIFEYELVRRDDCVLMVPAGSALDKKLSGIAKAGSGLYPCVDFAQLNGCDFIMLSENQVMQKLLDDVCRKTGVTLNPAVVCRSLEAEFALVREGVGPALLPSYMLKSDCSSISCYGLKQDIPAREIVVCRRRNYTPTKAVRDFIEIFKTYR
ncbi:MAG: LysR family transcriptional regulator [Lachnospiraceae bacterium]|nr:LysR family transcriptional regulator [Lachnospiraceae bacterium]